MTTTKTQFLIIGAGPAGMTAALYAARRGQTVTLLESTLAGGVMATLERVSNVPFVPDASGIQLAVALTEQLAALGVGITFDRVTHIDCAARSCMTASGQHFCGDKLVLAMGIARTELGLDGERGLVGRGVSYCATCDGNFFRGQPVVVVGSGRTALEDVKYLLPLASHVTLVSPRERLAASAQTLAQLQQAPNLTIHTLAQPLRLLGDPLSGVRVRTNHGQQLDIDAQGVFVAVGSSPATALVDGQLQLDESRAVITDEHMRTSVQGVFAIGDIRSGSSRQIVTACADGSICTR